MASDLHPPVVVTSDDELRRLIAALQAAPRVAAATESNNPPPFKARGRPAPPPPPGRRHRRRRAPAPDCGSAGRAPVSRRYRIQQPARLPGTGLPDPDLDGGRRRADRPPRAGRSLAAGPAFGRLGDREGLSRRRVRSGPPA